MSSPGQAAVEACRLPELATPPSSGCLSPLTLVDFLFNSNRPSINLPIFIFTPVINAIFIINLKFIITINKMA